MPPAGDLRCAHARCYKAALLTKSIDAPMLPHATRPAVSATSVRHNDGGITNSSDMYTSPASKSSDSIHVPGGQADAMGQAGEAASNPGGAASTYARPQAAPEAAPGMAVDETGEPVSNPGQTASAHAGPEAAPEAATDMAVDEAWDAAASDAMPAGQEVGWEIAAGNSRVAQRQQLFRSLDQLTDTLLKGSASASVTASAATSAEPAAAEAAVAGPGCTSQLAPGIPKLAAIKTDKGMDSAQQIAKDEAWIGGHQKAATSGQQDGPQATAETIESPSRTALVPSAEPLGEAYSPTAHADVDISMFPVLPAAQHSEPTLHDSQSLIAQSRRALEGHQATRPASDVDAPTSTALDAARAIPAQQFNSHTRQHSFEACTSGSAPEADLHLSAAGALAPERQPVHAHAVASLDSLPANTSATAEQPGRTNSRNNASGSHKHKAGAGANDGLLGNSEDGGPVVMPAAEASATAGQAEQELCPRQPPQSAMETRYDLWQLSRNRLIVRSHVRARSMQASLNYFPAIGTLGCSAHAGSSMQGLACHRPFFVCAAPSSTCRLALV